MDITIDSKRIRKVQCEMVLGGVELAGLRPGDARRAAIMEHKGRLLQQRAFETLSQEGLLRVEWSKKGYDNLLRVELDILLPEAKP